MKNPKLFKCKYCGEEVYEEYWEGELKVRELKTIGGWPGSAPHSCLINLNKESQE